MENTRALSSVNAGEQNGGLLYPTMLVAAMAVIIFSVIGIAAMTGLMPIAGSTVGAQPKVPLTNAAAKADGAVRPVSARAATVPVGAGGACADCGAVSSIRVIEAQSAPSGLGAVAGGVVGGVLGNQVGRGGGRTAMTVVGAGAGAYAGHEVEKKMSHRVGYEVRVRMEDGSYRTFIERSQPALAVGEKVRVTGDRIVAR